MQGPQPIQQCRPLPKTLKSSYPSSQEVSMSLLQNKQNFIPVWIQHCKWYYKSVEGRWCSWAYEFAQTSPAHSSPRHHDPT